MVLAITRRPPRRPRPLRGIEVDDDKRRVAELIVDSAPRRILVRLISPMPLTFEDRMADAVSWMWENALMTMEKADLACIQRVSGAVSLRPDLAA